MGDWLVKDFKSSESLRKSASLELCKSCKSSSSFQTARLVSLLQQLFTDSVKLGRSLSESCKFLFANDPYEALSLLEAMFQFSGNCHKPTGASGSMVGIMRVGPLMGAK